MNAITHVPTAERAIQPAASALMPKPLSQRPNTVSGTVIASRPPMATRRMKKLTATGVTDSRIFLFTTTTSAHNAVMTKAAAIQAA